MSKKSNKVHQSDNVMRNLVSSLYLKCDSDPNAWRDLFNILENLDKQTRDNLINEFNMVEFKRRFK